MPADRDFEIIGTKGQGNVWKKIVFDWHSQIEITKTIQYFNTKQEANKLCNVFVVRKLHQQPNEVSNQTLPPISNLS